MRKTRLILCVATAVLLFSTCANIPGRKKEMPVQIPIGDSLDKQHAEFAGFAEVLRPTRSQLTVRHSLRSEAHHDLCQVAEILGKYPEFMVVVAGHTDNIGQESHNQWLSERRAYAVADFLVAKGLDPNRIQVIGYGESRPIAANDTAQGRLCNRRVELYIIRKPS